MSFLKPASKTPMAASDPEPGKGAGSRAGQKRNGRGRISLLYRGLARTPCSPRPLAQPPTHGDVGKLVCAAVRVDAVKAGAVDVDTAEDKRRAHVALVAEETQEEGGWSVRKRQFFGSAKAIETKVIQGPLSNTAPYR